jgi:hypothetical protein
VINNIQAIPKHPPRIPGEDIGKPETEFSIAASTTISSIPSRLEHVNKNLRTGGKYYKASRMEHCSYRRSDFY